MPLSSETVSLPGSGLVFQNSYSSLVTDAYRGAVLQAENFLQSHFVNTATISVNFDFQPLGGDTVANNAYFIYRFDYASVRAALINHATTADDMIAVAGLPVIDPSGGVGFAMTGGEAQALGLRGPSGSPDDIDLVLSSSEPWTFGSDAIATFEHELTEGAFGRVEDLGISASHFSPFDLFRFAATGQRDFTGGRDGVQTYFGLDAAHVSGFALHNAISPSGSNDGGDFGDWDFTVNDAFGRGGAGIPANVSATDLQVLDVLGWTPRAAAGPTTGNDLIAGSSGGGDTIDALAGADTINAGGPGSNYLRGNDGDDSIVGGSGFDDINGNKGNDTIGGGATGDDWLVGGQGNDLITARGGNDLIYGNLGNDTLVGGTGNEIMRGGQGDDSLAGGSGNDFISGDRGADTMSGGAGADIFHSSQDAGIDRVLDFHLLEGDRVQLDPGTTFMVSQVGADTVIDMGSGNQMILVGVQMSSLTPGWIFGS
jgi:Ca2+-binding RTX toxin-like protein